MSTKHTSKWLIDAVLFTGLVISSWLDLTFFKNRILAHDPHPRLDRDSDPGDLKDRTPLVD